MEKLSEIDKKVIYELGKDSRQSYRQIAKNINSKKEVVAYHINELIKKNIITKFVPVFSLTKLGIFSNKIYLRLGGLTKESEQKLLLKLINNKKIAWVARSVGRWDLLLGFYSKNMIEFAKIKEQVLSDLSKYIEEYQISFIEDGLVFNRDYLINKKEHVRKEFIYGGELVIEKVDEPDRKIINLIKNNARIEVLKIADELDTDPRTMINRLKNMKQRGVLQGNTIFLDLKKIGFQLHKLCISIRDYDVQSVNGIVDYLKINPKIVHLIKSIGPWELEVEIEENNLENIYAYIGELKNNFNKIIKQIELVTITDELKLDFFPEKF